MRTILRLIAATLSLLAFVALPPSADAAGEGASFSIRPVRYDPQRPATRSYFIYETAPATTIDDEVLVRNGGTQSGTVRLYAADGLTGETSGSVFADRDAPREGVGAWVQLTLQELTLGPGEERRVPFTVRVPSGARPGQHLGGLVAEDTTFKTSATGGAILVNYQTRIVTAVQINLPGPIVERVAVTGIGTGGDQGYQRIVLGLRNEGTQMVKPTGTLLITDTQGREVQRIALKLDTFLPQTAIQYPVLVRDQALGAGQYRALVELTFGSQGMTRHEQAFTVSEAQVAQVFQAPAPLVAPSSPAQAANAQAPKAAAGSGFAGLVRQALLLGAVLAIGSAGTLLAGRLRRRGGGVGR